MNELVSNKIEKKYLARQELDKRIKELGAQITSDYSGEEIVLVCVLKGAFIFAADLCRCINLPQKIDFLAVSSYGDDVKSSGCVNVLKDISEDIAGKNVLIVEDIVDTGLTMSKVVSMLKDRKPKSIKVCTLCMKPGNNKKFVNIDYCGFELPDDYVVGYGLDKSGYFRNLPYIGIANNKGDVNEDI